MSDVTTEVKKGPFRNGDGEISLKKILGFFGSMIFFGACIFGIAKAPSESGEILDKLGWFSAGLLGLNLVNGVAATIKGTSNK